MRTAITLLLLSSVALADPLPECAKANFGQCVDVTPDAHNGQVCEMTPMGPGWIGQGKDCLKFVDPRLLATTGFATPAPGVMLAPTDAPLADPDAQGRAMKLEAGEIAPFKGVLLDDQEDAHRERSRVRAETGSHEWRTIAYASIGAGAAVTVALVLLTGLAAAHKL